MRLDGTGEEDIAISDTRLAFAIEVAGDRLIASTEDQGTVHSSSVVSTDLSGHDQKELAAVPGHLIYSLDVAGGRVYYAWTEGWRSRIRSVRLDGGDDRDELDFDDGRVTLWQIHVDCENDCDRDGVLDLFDYLCFTNRFNAQDPSADCDKDGSLSLFDFLCFVNAFNQGCG